MYQNAGEKGDPHRDPDDPPRRRANKFNGHGTYDNGNRSAPNSIGQEFGGDERGRREAA